MKFLAKFSNRHTRTEGPTLGPFDGFLFVEDNYLIASHNKTDAGNHYNQTVATYRAYLAAGKIYFHWEIAEEFGKPEEWTNVEFLVEP